MQNLHATFPNPIPPSETVVVLSVTSGTIVQCFSIRCNVYLSFIPLLFYPVHLRSKGRGFQRRSCIRDRLAYQYPTP